ncbi:polyisoprenoid-binding protein [Cellvibrio zantedeschiae]|uniref:Polyisoprenoid-binding protein n=1 Tax=Cellvibrio zantedeschiae TaxID=1237077 RepID=A0ABQ3B480_9GAMM|nr:YceI family protein [Cellvibrio zantedeschiae]GGY74479.1 polyisoprenoid-binding protein [Cellvibrio zantedeschiae]
MPYFSVDYKKILLISLTLLLSACGYLIQPKVKTGIVNLKPGAYQIDKQHTTVLFKINHMGMSTFVGRFNSVDASLEFDPAHMENANLSAVISIASIDVNNAELAETLRGSSWFDAEKYPQAFFKTTSVQLVDQSHAKFSGNLTLHGVVAPIVLDVVFNGGGENMLTGRYTIGFTATTSFKRSQFGMDYLVPAVGDEVNVEVFAEFQKR